MDRIPQQFQDLTERKTVETKIPVTKKLAIFVNGHIM